MTHKRKRRWDDRFHHILALSCIFYCMFALAVNLTTVPTLHVSATHRLRRLSPRFAKLILKPAKKQKKKIKVEKKRPKPARKQAVKKKARTHTKTVHRVKKVRKIKKVKSVRQTRKKLVKKHVIPKGSPKVKSIAKPAIKKTERLHIKPAVQHKAVRKTVQVAKVVPQVDLAEQRRIAAEAKRKKDELDRKVAMKSGLMNLLTADDALLEDKADSSYDIAFSNIDEAADVSPDAPDNKADNRPGNWNLTGAETADIDKELGAALADDMDGVGFGLEGGDDLGGFDFNPGGDEDAAVSDLIQQGDAQEGTLTGIETGQVENPFIVEGGGRSFASIELVLNRYKGQINQIYNRFLRKNRNLAGEISTEFLISHDGRIIEFIVIASTINYPPIEEAIKDLYLVTVRFPKLDTPDTGPTRVTNYILELHQ